MEDELLVVVLEVVVRVVWMVLRGRLRHLLKSQPLVGISFVSVVAILVARKGIVAEGFLLVGQDGEDSMHSISHVGQVFVDSVQHHKP
jgi:hypothetical protein